MAPRSSIFSYFYSEKPPEVKDGVADLPEPQDPQLFERAAWRSPDGKSKTATPGSQRPASASKLGANGVSPFSRPASAGAEKQTTPGGDGSLFDRYTTTPPAPVVPNPSTNSSRLRNAGIRITCYLNTETNKTPAQAVTVPEHVHTIKELLPIIQSQMRLNKKMLFARELFCPDGKVCSYLPPPPPRALTACLNRTSGPRVAAHHELPEACRGRREGHAHHYWMRYAPDRNAHASRRSANTPARNYPLLGAGEPFDSYCVPPSMLLAHQAGGGRAAAVKIRREFEAKGEKLAHLRADQVRAAGHGTSMSAARAAKVEKVETNRQQAAQLRHEHMVAMLQVAEDQERLVARVRGQNEISRSERAGRVERLEETKKDRIHELAAQRRRSATHRIFTVQTQQAEISSRKAMVAKQVRSKEEMGLTRAKQSRVEASRARGAARRMSSAARAVKRAELADLEQQLRKAQHDRVAGTATDY